MSDQATHIVPVLTTHGSIHSPPPLKKLQNEDDNVEEVQDTDLPEGEQPDTHHGLHRGLSARQVSMIAIAGTIGTGLFLGTGRSLAQGCPASMLICYAIVGLIVYVTLLLLGEMATQYPVAGEFSSSADHITGGTYVDRFRIKAPSMHTRHVSFRPRMASRCRGTIGLTTLSRLPQISPLHNLCSASGQTTIRGW